MLHSEFDRLVKLPLDKPFRGWRWYAALCVAMCVHAVAVMLLVLGSVAIVTLPLLMKLLIGVPALALAWFARPRLGRMPADVVSRNDTPELYALLDEIAAVAGTRAPDAVEIDARFNAYFTRVGLRRRRLMGIGAAMWVVERPAERVATLGHEVGHDVNNDMRSGLVVGSALTALEDWHDFVVPDERDVGAGELSFGDMLGRAIGHAIAAAIRGTYRVLTRLSNIDGQRAEYLADEISARVAGTDAAVASLERVCVDSTVDFVVHARRYGANDVWRVLRETVDALPELELERRRRAAALHDLSVDSTHPATHLRIRFLRERAPRAPAVVLIPERAALIDAELSPYLDRAARELYETSR